MASSARVSQDERSTSAAQLLLHRTWEALQSLDPARLDERELPQLRATLEAVRRDLRALAAEGVDGAEVLGELEQALAALPDDDDPRGWEQLRGRLARGYEDAAQELGVAVPRLRPTNYTRSLFHAGSALAVLTFLELADERLVRWTASCALAVAVFLETSRRWSRRWNDLLMKVLGPVAHPAERYRINSASNYILALFVLAWIGYVAVGAVAVVVLGFADPVASFVGRRWGRTPLMHGRTLEGSLAFVAAGFVAASATLTLLHPEIPRMEALAIAGVGALVGALAELASGRVDDNLTIPVLTAGAAWAAAAAMDVPLVGFR